MCGRQKQGTYPIRKVHLKTGGFPKCMEFEVRVFLYYMSLGCSEFCAWCRELPS